MATLSGMKKWIWSIAVVSSLTGTLLAQDVKQEVQSILAYQPRQKSAMAIIAMPTPAEQAKCVFDAKMGPSGAVWTLKDGQGKVLRQILDTNKDNKPDVFCYFSQGVEVYREVDSKFSGRIDKFMWLNSGGMKTGVDVNGDGNIDQWASISLEEVTQEVVQALVTKDMKYLQAVMIDQSDVQALGINQAEVSRISKVRQDAVTKFQSLIKKFPNINETTKWVQVITNPPGRIPSGDRAQGEIICHSRATIILDTGGKTDQIVLGDVYQVGQSWKLVDMPMSSEEQPVGGPVVHDQKMPEDGPLQKLIQELAELDKNAPKAVSGTDEAMSKYHLSRVSVLTKIAEASPATEKLNWQKQIVDSLSASASSSTEKKSQGMELLAKMVTDYYKADPKSEITGYTYYRWVVAEYNLNMSAAKNPKEIANAQIEHVKKLDAYVKNYPQAPDAPEAMLQAGVLCEYLDKEDEAKKWYQALMAMGTNTQQTALAVGSMRRLEGVGKNFDIGLNKDFNPATVRNKFTVYYYWASWCGTVEKDFEQFTALKKENSKVEVVAINVDDNPQQGAALAAKLKAIHLSSPGNLSSPAATHLGLNMFPAMFLAGPDGKLISRNVDPTSIADEIKKAK